jgi:drug/metabolite transporter (DMT)-like permease
MNYEWAFLSVLAAFGQACGWALKKKTLESKGINNTLGCVSFAVAGLILVLMHVAVNGWILPHITWRFIEASAVVIVANVIGAWAAYRAIDRAPLSSLMPYFAVTSLTIVPIEFFFRDALPQALQIFGIALIVLGAIFLSANAMPDKTARKALGLFALAILCYSFSSPFIGVAVDETQSGLFSAAVFHLGIAAGFVPLIFLAKEPGVILRLGQTGEWKKAFLLMLASGVVIALLENGPATVALLTAKASEVFALKRTMPFFALILGTAMFHEKVTKRHIFGTALLVAGSMFVVWFR